MSVGPLLALIGGAVAAGSAWLAWMTGPGGLSGVGIDATGSEWGIANGYYLVAAGALAAVCGLVLVLGLATSPGTRQLLALGALVGGVGACAIDVAAYMKVNDFITQFNGMALPGGVASGYAVGMGIYVGGGAGAVAALGGFMSLTARPVSAGTGAGAGSQTGLLLGLVLIAAIVVGGIVAWPEIQKQTNGSPATPPVVFVTPAPGKTATPTGHVNGTPRPSFLTAAYGSPEGAIEQWVTDQSMAYDGDCASATHAGSFCSTMVDKLPSGLVYAVGAVSSEAQVFVLVAQVGGKYYVADVASASGTPPWH